MEDGFFKVFPLKVRKNRNQRTQNSVSIRIGYTAITNNPQTLGLATKIYFSFMFHVYCRSTAILLYVTSLWDLG